MCVCVCVRARESVRMLSSFKHRACKTLFAACYECALDFGHLLNPVLQPESLPVTSQPQLHSQSMLSNRRERVLCCSVVVTMGFSCGTCPHANCYTICAKVCVCVYARVRVCVCVYVCMRVYACVLKSQFVRACYSVVRMMGFSCGTCQHANCDTIS
jgi:hypothetical protein